MVTDIKFKFLFFVKFEAHSFFLLNEKKKKAESTLQTIYLFLDDSSLSKNKGLSSLGWMGENIPSSMDSQRNCWGHFPSNWILYYYGSLRYESIDKKECFILEIALKSQKSDPRTYLDHILNFWHQSFFYTFLYWVYLVQNFKLNSR